jgi:peptidoglycan/LPS O-acetylase OafA/YrhL
MAGRKEIRPLTGFRGVAALAVATYHFMLSMAGNPPFVLSGGYLAVDAFFVLSGYVLAYNYAGVFGGSNDRAAYLDFLFKRFARLYPAYIVLTLLYALKLALKPDGLDGFTSWDAICNLLMLTGWGLHATPVVGLSWSVSAELFCYAAFPLILLLARERPLPAFLSVALMALVIMVISRVGGGIEGPLDVVSDVNLFPLLRALAGFSLGVILCGVASRMKVLPEQTVNLFMLLSAAALVAAAVFDRSDLITYAAVVCMVFWVAQDSDLSNVLFGNRPIYRLGEISYSFYLIHPFIISVLARAIGKLQALAGNPGGLAITFALYIGSAILLSELSYRFLEMRGKAALMRLRHSGFRVARQ